MPMCEKCAKIARYQRISEEIHDASLFALVNGFITDLGSEKAALHPKQKGTRPSPA